MPLKGVCDDSVVVPIGLWPLSFMVVDCSEIAVVDIGCELAPVVNVDAAGGAAVVGATACTVVGAIVGTVVVGAAVGNIVEVTAIVCVVVGATA